MPPPLVFRNAHIGGPNRVKGAGAICLKDKKGKVVFNQTSFPLHLGIFCLEVGANKPNWAINVCKLTINIGQNIRRYMKVKINNSETGRRKKWSEIFRAGKYIIIGGKEKLRRKKDFF